MPLPWPQGWVLYWEVAAQLIQALSVPITVVTGLLVAIPVIQKILNTGGSIEAFGARLSIAQQVAEETRKLSLEVDKNITDDAQEEGGETSPSIVTEQPVFTTGLEAIRSGWTLIDQATREALRSVNAPAWIAGYLNQTPIYAFNWLTIKEWIGFPLRDTIKALRELYDNALANGGANLTESAARDFNIAAQKAARAIQNAVSYRLRKRLPETAEK